MPRPGKLYHHNGEARTLTAWAAFVGVPKNTLEVRLRRGWAFERALSGEKLQRPPKPKPAPKPRQPKPPVPKRPRPPRPAKRLTFENETLTIPEWSEITGYSVATIRNRLKAGWPIERTLTTDPKPGRPRKNPQ